LILINHLSKNYGANHVLKNINLNFLNGKVYGIVGENGAGKTTLFRCIAGLEDFQGEIISEYKLLKNYIGLLLTQPYIFKLITGREYIRLITSARQNKIMNIDSKNIFDLPLDHYAHTYSTGMKKKLALLAILLQDNKCYIFDEPFNGVDIISNLIIIEIIHKLKSLGKTILISSHIFSTLKDTCDEIFILKNSEIIKHVYKDSFDALENEMKSFSIDNKVHDFFNF